MDIGDDNNLARGTPEHSARASRPRQGTGTLSFDEIYREYGGRILNLLYRFTSREQVARDLHQDVFIKVYENMDAFEQRSHVYTWIYRIAVNHALNYLKRERRALWLNIMDETVGELLKQGTIEVPGLGAGEALRPDVALERSETGKLINRAVESLPPNYRIPFVLYKDEQLSYAEIAEVLDISLSAVESRIHRARKMLIKRLGPLIE